MSDPRIKSGSRGPARAIARSVHETTPLPAAPSWAGYWTFVSAAIIVMFILYTAEKKTLSTWLSFFSWASPAAIANAGAATAASASAGASVGAASTGGTGTGAALGATVGAAATTLQGVQQTWGNWFGGIMSSLGISSGGAFSGSPSAGTAGVKGAASPGASVATPPANYGNSGGGTGDF